MRRSLLVYIDSFGARTPGHQVLERVVRIRITMTAPRGSCGEFDNRSCGPPLTKSHGRNLISRAYTATSAILIENEIIARLNAYAPDGF